MNDDANTRFTRLEVQPNDNCDEQPMLVFKNVGPAARVSMVRLYEGAPEGRVYHVTGWTSAGGGSPCPAYAVQVEDSGSGVVHLVYGSDWGLRLRSVESNEEWGMGQGDQHGESHLLLADAEDVFTADA
jgi:hypothetical protein